MDAAHRLARLAQLGRVVSQAIKDVGAALGAVRGLLLDAEVAFRIVGGVAVVHHGYARLTEDIDLLVEAGGPKKLEPHLEAHAFRRVDEERLVHEPTGVRIDLLEAGTPMPRGAAVYPTVEEAGTSGRDEAFVSLSTLLALKVRAHRKQDEADVVALLKPLDEGAYLELEAAIAPSLRLRLLRLREDALEELRWERPRD